MPMNRRVLFSGLAILVVTAAVSAGFLVRKRKNDRALPASPPPSQSPSAPSPDLAASVQAAIANEAWYSTPPTQGAPPNSPAGEHRYVVVYEVVFLRQTPSAPVPEESMPYSQLQLRDEAELPPHAYFGETLSGTFDPSHPGSIAVRFTFNQKEVKGFVDAGKLWQEPPLAQSKSPRYMILKDDTKVPVVPDAQAQPALTLLQGEVIDAVGQVTFQDKVWVKARFLGGENPRYGFFQEADVLPLLPSTVNPSVLQQNEIPSHIRNAKAVLDGPGKQALLRNGFYVEPIPPDMDIGVDDLFDSYSRYRADWGKQFFLTSDHFLHAHHLIFDRMLQDIEEQRFSPMTVTLSSTMARTAAAELAALPRTAPDSLRGALAYDLLYFSVAARLFDPAFPLDPAVQADASAVLALIDGSAKEADLPPSLRNTPIAALDFSRFLVRGHYVKNETLMRYFRGMMWFGTHNFSLSDRKMTLAALLIPGLLEKARMTEPVERLDKSLEYLVGAQDKYTLAGYRSINKKVFSTESPSASALVSGLDERLDTFAREAASTLPPPRIVSSATGPGLTQKERLQAARGFKFLGQRFTLDACFFNQLTSPSVGSDANPRNLPATLDVMMLLGSKAAAGEMQQTQKSRKWDNYDSQVAKLRPLTAQNISQPSTFYAEWLSSLNSLFLPTSSKQFFALGTPWQYKSLNAASASWTELKHDTILYSEQSAAEMGEGGEFEIPPYEPPAPKGYVEPNPIFFQRLARSVDALFARLQPTGFLTEEYVSKFTTFRELAQRAERIAAKEISGETISRVDYQWIEEVHSYFDWSLLLPQGSNVIKDRSQLRMALIADVATDAINGRYLEVSTGSPQRIVVMVKDTSGGARLTVGYVYSWFEFPSPKRWPDSEWQKLVYSENPAAKLKNAGIEPPSWYSIFSKTPPGAH